MANLVVEFRGKPEYKDDDHLRHWLLTVAQQFGFQFFSSVSSPKEEDDKIIFVKKVKNGKG